MSEPVALSLWYIETNRHPAAYLRVDPSSRTNTEGHVYDSYVCAVHDRPNVREHPRCVQVYGGYLETKCKPVDLEDVPEFVKADLESILARKNEPFTWTRAKNI